MPRPRRLPTVLTRPEVAALLQRVNPRRRRVHRRRGAPGETPRYPRARRAVVPAAGVLPCPRGSNACGYRVLWPPSPLTFL